MVNGLDRPPCNLPHNKADTADQNSDQNHAQRDGEFDGTDGLGIVRLKISFIGRCHVRHSFWPAGNTG